jgi:cytochrome c-type biogenesis protein CcmH
VIPGIALGAVLLLASGQYAPQRAGSAPLESKDQEARVQRLGKLIRCPVCQGVSIADSPSSMARSQLDKVREMVGAGKSDEEIKGYFVERYDEWALLEPKREGFNWIVWAGPVLFLLIGGAIIARQVKRGPRPAAGGPAPSVEPAAPADDPYLRRVREELER